ncbi:MAG: adenylate/guanylate cyclase domain-containing protein [Actinomycetia bacterium]|nr:adenylate/guanylate cyclase domain-containing protein [Actinomycetes bacterium]
MDATRPAAADGAFSSPRCRRCRVHPCSRRRHHGSLAVKIGLTVGEPVEDSDDLFGASVNLAARICAHAAGSQTLASGTVRDLAIGNDIHFRGMGEIGLRGFPEPVTLYEIAWSD